MGGSPFGTFRDECISLTERALDEVGVAVSDRDMRFTTPKDPNFGNLSLSTFNMAKSTGAVPRELAAGVVERINGYLNRSRGLAMEVHGEAGLVSRVVCAGDGYVNFFIDFARFNRLTMELISSLGAGYGLAPPKGKRVMVEHTSVNPIHPIHIGGARNAVIGDCLSRVLKAAGNQVERHFYIDDVGLQVAQASYGFSNISPLRVEGKSDHFIGLVYASTSCAMSIKSLKLEVGKLESEGKDEAAREKIKELDDWVAAAAELREKNDSLFDAISDSISWVDDPEAEVNRLLKRYEGREEDAIKAIRSLSELALAGFKETLSRVGIEFDSWDWESELTSWSGRAEEVVNSLSATDLVKVEKGTVILDTELTANRFGLKERYSLKTEVPPLTLKRSDGTTLYTTRDIAYTLWKFERVDEAINVISIEQKLPQLQLKLALYALGRGDLAERLIHFSYELVHLPGYKMSGRRGRFVAFDDVLNEAVERAYREVTLRSPQLGEEEKRRISVLVGLGAVRYAMIAVAPGKPITFTWDRVLNFEQNSAPFIQYAHARASNILVRAGEAVKYEGIPDYGSLISRYEMDLVVKIGSFPDMVEEAARSLRPEMIADYSNDLASKFNLFYDNVPVLKTEDPATRAARLRLVAATKAVLANALSLIGIEAPSRM